MSGRRRSQSYLLVVESLSDDDADGTFEAHGVAMSGAGGRGSSGQVSNGSNNSGGSHSDPSQEGDDSLADDVLYPNNKAAPPSPESAFVQRQSRDKADAWWSVGEFLEGKGGVPLTHQSAKLTLTGNRVFGNQRDDIWDLSDSLMELYETIQRTEGTTLQQMKRNRNSESPNKHVDVQDWLSKSGSHGFIRVYAPDMINFANSRLVPLTLSTTVQQVAHTLGLSMNAMHVQMNGDVIRRMEAYEHPLVLQNEYLTNLGYSDMVRIQEEGPRENLGYLIRFYSGKPMMDSTFSRNQLQAFLEIRRGGVLQNWTRRLCVLSGTRLLIYKDKYKRTEPLAVQLAKGAVEDYKVKGHDFCLKLTCTQSGPQYFFLAFTNETEYNKWFKKCKKATDKLPTSADLSNCHLEFLPESIFVNDQLSLLNLRHNVLRERPIEEDIFIIGWLDDLHRFTRLRSLNLADNQLASFPLAICNIRTLVELNIASNKLEEIPPDIAELGNLQALHIHNNHLTALPDELMHLRKLFILVLAFNRFSTVPPVVAQMTNIRVSEIENIIMAGNRIERIPSDTLMEMKYVKKVDLRMNRLTLPNNETLRFSVLEHVTHLDIRENLVVELDIRALKTLEYLNCERNEMAVLRLNGMQLKNVFAAHNCLEVLQINPKPEYLYQLDVSYNVLMELPDWLSDCFFLHRLNASHNLLASLPGRLFLDAKKLRSLRVNHNRLAALPSDIDTTFIEEIYVNHNMLTSLPEDFFVSVNKLRVFNASRNKLTSLPALNENPDLNKVQELYLTANALGDSAVNTISDFRRLKILHLAHNEIHNIYDESLEKLELLQELNISGNQLRELPKAMGLLTRLVVLRAHSNALHSLPDFRKAKALRVLDVGHNQLHNVSVTHLMASQLNLLDMSLNAQLKVNPREFKTVKNRKSVCLVDLTGQNRDLPGLARRPLEPESEEVDPSSPWKVGFSETSGMRNKLCIVTVRIPKFGSDNEAIFGMFDGGHNNEIPKILMEKLPEILKSEMRHKDTSSKYMLYTMLSAHRCLKHTGQKLGVSGTLLHLRRLGSDSEQLNQYTLQLANLGDVETVLCRRGEALLLTRKFVTTEDRDECDRIMASDGIITEDNKVHGVTKNTRLLGCAFLYPHIIPLPYTASVALRNDDEFLIVANRGLWRYLSYAEAVEHIYEIGNPVVAAKKLQDVAQGYGSRENVAVMVIRLNTERGPSLGRLRPLNREMSIDDVEAAAKHDALRARRLASSAQPGGGRDPVAAAPAHVPAAAAVARKATAVQDRLPAPSTPQVPSSRDPKRALAPGFAPMSQAGVKPQSAPVIRVADSRESFGVVSPAHSAETDGRSREGERVVDKKVEEVDFGSTSSTNTVVYKSTDSRVTMVSVGEVAAPSVTMVNSSNAGDQAAPDVSLVNNNNLDKVAPDVAMVSKMTVSQSTSGVSMVNNNTGDKMAPSDENMNILPVLDTTRTPTVLIPPERKSRKTSRAGRGDPAPPGEPVGTIHASLSPPDPSGSPGGILGSDPGAGSGRAKGRDPDEVSPGERSPREGSPSDMADQPVRRPPVSRGKSPRRDPELTGGNHSRRSKGDRKVAPPLSSLKPLPNQRYTRKSTAQDWEALLQKRLSSEIKDKELKQMTGGDDSSEHLHRKSPPPALDPDPAVSKVKVKKGPAAGGMGSLERGQGQGQGQGKRSVTRSGSHGEGDHLAVGSEDKARGVVEPRGGPKDPTPVGLKGQAPAAPPWVESLRGAHTANPAYAMNPGISNQDLYTMTATTTTAGHNVNGGGGGGGGGDGSTATLSSSPEKKPNVRSRIALFEKLNPNEVEPESPTRASPVRKSFMAVDRPAKQGPPPRRALSPPPNMIIITRSQAELDKRNGSRSKSCDPGASREPDPYSPAGPGPGVASRPGRQLPPPLHVPDKVRASSNAPTERAGPMRAGRPVAPQADGSGAGHHGDQSGGHGDSTPASPRVAVTRTVRRSTDSPSSGSSSPGQRVGGGGYSHSPAAQPGRDTAAASPPSSSSSTVTSTPSTASSRSPASTSPMNSPSTPSNPKADNVGKHRMPYGSVENDLYDKKVRKLKQSERSGQYSLGAAGGGDSSFSSGSGSGNRKPSRTGSGVVIHEAASDGPTEVSRL